MKKILIGTLLLCIWHSIILVNQSWGINVLLFTIPLLGLILSVLKEHKCIKNKAGLLLIIPILVLSTSYFIYDNTWKYLNVLVLPFLYLLLYIFTMKPVKTIGDTIVEILNLMIKPLNSIGNFTKEGVKLIPVKTKGEKKKEKKSTKYIQSFLMILPIVILVLVLLASADSIFGQLFQNLFSWKWKGISIDEIFTRTIIFASLFFYLGATLYFIGNHYLKEKRVKEEEKEREPLTINMLLIILNVIYLIFDIIQINSLMLHRVSSGFNYAEYARSGFFQLMFISFINISILLLSKKCKEQTKTKIMSIIMILLTYIIIASSYLRMSLYEAAYGYTILRLGVYAILLTEAILLVPTIYYVINKKLNILNFYLVITIAIYTAINCFSVDRVIANNNIARYKRTGQIDLYYLQNTNYDNLNQLRELYELIQEDDKIEQIDKDNLNIYIRHMDKRNEKTIFGYNLSKEEARKQTTWNEKEKRD